MDFLIYISVSLLEALVLYALGLTTLLKLTLATIVIATITIPLGLRLAAKMHQLEVSSLAWWILPAWIWAGISFILNDVFHYSALASFIIFLACLGSSYILIFGQPKIKS